MSLVPGSTFGGRYQILKRIAEGGMGAVYEVLHVETGRRRALKVLHPHVLKDRKAREQFRREARIGGVIESEAVVDVFDAGIDDASGTPFLVMELLRGEDLNRRVERNGPAGPAEVVSWLRQVSFALDKAHRAGVVHRDLKPDNMFLHERDQGATQVKILDFGVAKIVRDANKITGDTLSVGTPMFMAPEQFTGSHPVTGAADRYAIAHVAYALLVGEPYFDPETEVETALMGFMRRVVEGAVEPPVKRALARRNVRLPEAFDRWFLRATSPDPEKRHSSTAALVDHLETALGLSWGESPTVAMRRDVDDAPTPATGEPARGLSTVGDAPLPGSTTDPSVGAPGIGPPRYNTISGTTTPHRAQRTTRAVLGVGGAAAAGLVLGLGIWMYAGRVDRGAPAPSPATLPVTDVPTERDPPPTVAPAPGPSVEPAPSSPEASAAPGSSAAPSSSAAPGSSAGTAASSAPTSRPATRPPRVPGRPPPTAPSPAPTPPRYSRD